MGPLEGNVLDAAAQARFRALVDANYDFVWRSLRRLGVAGGDVDDGAQKVLLTLARKLSSVREGSERSFLFQTALRVAADSRRALRRRPDIPSIQEAVDPSPPGDELIDRRRARARLDEILNGMSMSLRAVFVLAELDEMTMADIAVFLDLPVGTVASRLRRARAHFRQKAAKLRSNAPRQGGGT